MSTEGYPDTPAEAGLWVHIRNLQRERSGLEKVLRSVLTGAMFASSEIDEIVAKAKAGGA